uniref:NADH-ubiquinone oxidoreductase chain 1 n=11 Tax=Junonia TaxID=39707 RepID=A0A1W5WWV2_9NEOP|nr:NADH dehydrogenase subunit 1 [Junonia coenia]YP_010417439.1 NADH dehydrogenase subunit 1 [Junonia evarete]YP_010417582.1 NADH dehydrogenase subunit 1 [Junonia nigrosuffusa]ANZ03486.1 NADH dehydrogenase subunit 1 [Junonia iphita]APC61716.1 NADH dehydrogenase subunit 1 [Junonia coenia bergi]ARH11346.1 NADH dehydrogenase subunit 1 [Junonia litoralis]ARH11359.1 NADH dehydrogenase subunit 1 [Junonia evarete flirtea]ARH11372.1 NADH dehydrogenase subunit 1 [Junonia genoveva hilaris]ARH11411.1 N
MMLMDLLNILIGMLVLIIGVLIGVAFLTLLERKVLGYIQIRKGPNKMGYMGLLQPFCDAIKLFSKEQVYLNYSNYLVYYFSPVMSFILSLMVWMLIPYMFNMIMFNLGILFFLCCTSIGVYTLMVAGWSSNSNYSLLGGLRAVAQTISYEVSMSLIMMSSIIMIMDFNLMKFFDYQIMIWFMFMMMPLSLCFLSSLMAETNRTPFDFAEGESELVSGFNIEYSSGGFALIFLSEYSSILFMSLLFVIMYMGGYDLTLIFYLKLVFLSFFFIWVRGTLPRYRYDKLMYLCWKSYLPISLNFLLFFMGLKMFLGY